MRVTIKQIAEEAGLRTECIIAPDQSRSASSQTVREYVQTYGLPECIFCHNDEMAIGGITAYVDWVCACLMTLPSSDVMA